MAQQRGQPPPWTFAIANNLLLSKIKKAIGLENCFLFAYGAAPMKQSTIDFFAALDMPLFNFYGLSETTGTATVHHMFNFSLLHAGMKTTGSQIVIHEPDENGEGEILISGRHVMMGYKDNEKATRESVDENGFLRTGDRGLIDKEGQVKITGRIKELIITAGGENIAPVPIEDNFKNICTCCSNIMLVGENRRFVSAVITFKVELDPKNGRPTDTLEEEARDYFKEHVGLEVKTSQELLRNKLVIDHVQKCVDEANKKAVSRAAYIKKFTLLPYDFSFIGGMGGSELTPTMKLKRKVTEQKYAQEIEEMYKVDAKL